MKVPTPAKSVALIHLASLDKTALMEQWQQVFAQPAPRYAQATLLRSALAWQLQCQQSGSTDKTAQATIRQLRRILLVPKAKVYLTPGMRLVREWQENPHHVTVLEKGFDYQGRTYSSLTAITRLITGTPWSGPLFFVLRT